MMFCSKCGAQLEEGARFCTVCGTKVELEAVTLQQENVNTETVLQKESPELAENVQKNFGEQPQEQPEQQEQQENPEVSEYTEQPVISAPEPQYQEVQSVPEQEQFIPPHPQVQAPPSAQGVDYLTPEQIAVMAKQAKRAEKARKLAEKQAKKQNAAANKAAAVFDNTVTYSGCKPKRKVGALGVIFAIILSILLVASTALIYACSVGAGITLADLRGYEIIIDDEVYSLDALYVSAGSFERGEMKELLESISTAYKNPIIEVDGERYELELDTATIDALYEAAYGDKAITGFIDDIIWALQGILFITFVGILSFSVVFTVIIILGIKVSLGGGRKALRLPSVIMCLLGFVFLLFSLLAILIPNSLGIIVPIFSSLSVSLFSLISSGAILLFGIIFAIVSATGKDKA